MSPDQLTGGLQQLGEMAAKDSILNAILRATDEARRMTEPSKGCHGQSTGAQ
jgi:hypothetical protein